MIYNWNKIIMNFNLFIPETALKYSPPNITKQHNTVTMLLNFLTLLRHVVLTLSPRVLELFEEIRDLFIALFVIVKFG